MEPNERWLDEASLVVGCAFVLGPRCDRTFSSNRRPAARLLALCAVLLAASTTSRVRANDTTHAERAAFAGDPARRTLRLGVMRGDARGATDRALRAAFIEAVQANAAETFWGWRRTAGRWLAQEDGAGFVAEAGGLGLVPARGENELAAASPRARLATRAVGRVGSLRTAESVAPFVEGNRARRFLVPGVEEHWVHGPLGLEQVWVFAERPAGDGPVVVEVRVDGDLVPRLDARGEVEFVDPRGRIRGGYGELFVRDVDGERRSAWLFVHGRVIRVVFDDAGARYPVIVDPLVWLEQATLAALGGAEGQQFGVSVALSSDGERALVGAPRDHVGSSLHQGSAYVFVRSGRSWSEETKLTDAAGATNDWFGSSVALSSDGTRALVGAPRHGGTRGAAYVFARSDTTWSEEARLTASDGGTNDFLGWSVALSGDAIRALAGAMGDDSGRGSVTVFVRSGATWSEEQKLVASDGSASASLGSSVSCSSDGLRAVAGAPGFDSGRGAAYVFARSGTTWSEEARLTASDGASDDQFGLSVALSVDGLRAMVGARRHDVGGNADQGAAYVFARSGTRWSEEARLTASDGAANDQFGSSVAIADDGLVALVGALFDSVRGFDARGSGRVFRLARPDGETCSMADECHGGMCVGGFCRGTSHDDGGIDRDAGNFDASTMLDAAEVRDGSTTLRTDAALRRSDTETDDTSPAPSSSCGCRVWGARGAPSGFALFVVSWVSTTLRRLERRTARRSARSRRAANAPRLRIPGGPVFSRPPSLPDTARHRFRGR